MDLALPKISYPVILVLGGYFGRLVFNRSQFCNLMRRLGDEKVSEVGGALHCREDRQISRSSVTVMLRGAVAGALLSLCVSPSLTTSGVCVIMGCAISVIVSEAYIRSDSEKRRRAIDYFLPIVMERIVMAVESGLDILPAIAVVVGLERQENVAIDPVTELFSDISRYTESGISLSDTLDLMERRVSSSAFRHALVHLGLAHKEGGDIIQPLRELSDATQLHFQESVEEEIARMPIKATIPLLCTFAGLIILFLAAPLVQVMIITARAAPVGL